VTGADGMLGQALMSRLDSVEAATLTENEFKLEDRDGTIKAVLGTEPDWVIHTAAKTDVDGCELDREGAFRINALGTRNVALACAQCGAGMLYISTDFVFGSREVRDTPIEAWEQPAPLSSYGISKWGGERYVEKLVAKFIIARTAWLYGEGGHHFIGTILALAKKRKLKVVNDQIGSPSYAGGVAEGVVSLREAGVPGWYHVVNSGTATWFDVAVSAVRAAGLDPGIVTPCSTSEFPRPAPRPAYSVLSTFTYKETVGVDFRPWQEALEEFVQNPKRP